MRAVKFFKDAGNAKKIEKDYPKIMKPIDHIKAVLKSSITGRPIPAKGGLARDE